MVDSIVEIQKTDPEICVNRTEEDIDMNVISESALIKIEEIFERTHDLLSKHYTDYDNVDQFEESCDKYPLKLNENDYIREMKASCERINNLNVDVAKLLSAFRNVTISSSNSNRTEEVEQYTQYFEDIHRGTQKLMRFMLASQKLCNGFKRISNYTSSLPNLSENPAIQGLNEILSSLTCCLPSSTTPSGSTSCLSPLLSINQPLSIVKK
ncbi:unnamed protein product [Heterobilharzia americana]|nr:unnamed protein product [Heterobilharzia americana]